MAEKRVKKRLDKTKRKNKPKRIETTSSVRIDKQLNDQLEFWLKTDVAKGLGFHSKSNFINDALRDAIQRVRGPRFVDLVINDGDYNMVDNRLQTPNDFVVVAVDYKHKTLNCTFCKSNICDHIMYIWQSPIQRAKLKNDMFEMAIKFGKYHYDV